MSSQPPARSSGRGGMGNMSSAPNLPVEHDDLRTPTIKSQTYTTGRGGSGNMATNDPLNPSVARAAQDVEAPGAVLAKEPHGTYHWGRGGEGNMMTVNNQNSSSGNSSGGVSAGNKGKVDGETERKMRDGQDGEVGEARGRENESSNHNNNPARLLKKERSGSLQGVIDRGREMLRLKKEERKV